MFDFDDADTEGPACPSSEEAEAQAAAALEHLRDGEWKVRWDAWRVVGKLGAAAAPHLKALEQLARRERDSDVRSAARGAVEGLRAAEEQRLLDPVRIEETVEWARKALSDTAWDVRRDACRLLGKSGALALPHLPELQALATKDEDMEVRCKARDALLALDGAGLAPFTMPEVRRSSAEVRRPSADVEIDLSAVDAAGLDPVGPHASFQILSEVLPMRLERERMTPAEVAGVWEKHWGVQYARRLRFIHVEGDTETLLDPQSDVVPLSPSTIRLQIKSPGILYNLRAAMKQFGEIPAEDVLTERETIRQQIELAAKQLRQLETRGDAEQRAPKDDEEEPEVVE